MGKQSAPEAPDPKQTSAAQTGTNVATAVANAVLQNPNQSTPFGDLTYTFDADNGYSWRDSYTGKSYTIPGITATQTLTEEGQQVQDNNVQTQINLSELSANQSGFLGDYMTTPFQYNAGDHEQWATGLYDKVNGGQISQEREAMASRLAQQGIGVGTEAYKNAMSSMYDGQQTARDRFMLDSFQQGQQAALTSRNQPINEIIGLMSGSQVQKPNFVNSNISGIPTTDNASIINNNYQQELAAWQQNQAAAGSMFSGLGGLFQGAGSLGLRLSDARAKEDAEKIGETKDGLGIYSYRYKGDSKTQIGLMAQEVAQAKPDAVKTTPSGLMAVDYKKALN